MSTAVFFAEEPTPFADGSGAPAVARCRGAMYACDFVGGVSLALIGGHGSKLAAKLVRAAYAKRVASFGPEFLARNVALYGAAVSS